MSVQRWAALLVALVLGLVASPALAQSTGGSFGGGSFGRSSSSGSSSSGSWGSGSSSSGSSWGSSGSSSSSGSSWGSSGSSSSSGASWGGSSSSGSSSSGPTRSRSSGGSGIGLGGGLCFLLAFVGVVGFVIFTRSKKGGGGALSAPFAPSGLATYHGPDAMYVSQLSIGVDWRARRELQAALTRLAETGDTKSPQGLASLLRETVLALRRAELSWLYVAQKSAGPLSPASAEQQFNQLTTSARAAFRHELVRAQGGEATTESAPAMRASSSEGEGTVVVHLIVAAYRPLAGAQSPDAGQLRMALDNRAALTAEQLGALEVVWSPAAEEDRMSTAELEQLYPDMRLVDPNSIAGRIFCSYCRGPFAMELLNCPHCGAPAEDSKENRSLR